MNSTPMNSRPGSILPTPSISPNLSPFANPPKNHIDSDDEGIYKQEWININKQQHNSNFMSHANVTKPASPPANTLRELEANLESLRKENFNLKLQIFYMRGFAFVITSNFSEQLQKLNRKYDQSQIEDLINENISQKVSLEERGKELAERNQLLVKARDAISELQHELETTRRQSVGSTDSQQVYQLRSENEQLRSRLSSMQAELESLQRSFSDKSRSVDSRLESVMQENARLKQQLSSQQLENETLRKQAQQSQQQASSAQNQQHQVAELNRKMKELSEQLAAKQREITTLTEEYSDKSFQLEMQKADLKVQLEEKTSILKEKEKLLQETLDTLENITHQSRVKEEQLKRAESTNQTVEQLKNLLKQRETEVNQLTEEVMQKNTKLQQLMNQLNQTQRHLADSKMNLTEQIETEREQYEKQLQDYKQEIDTLQTSYQLKLSNSEQQGQQLLREHQSKLQTAKNDFIQALNVEIQKREKLEDKLRQYEHRNSESDATYKSHLQERNILLLHSMKKLNELLSTLAPSNEENDISFTEPLNSSTMLSDFEQFQNRFIRKLNQLSRMQHDFQTKTKTLDHKFTNAFNNLQDVLQDKVKQLSQLEHAVKALKNEKHQANSIIQDLQNKIDVLELDLQKYNDMQEEWSRDKHTIEEMRSKWSQSQNEIAQARDKISKLTKELEGARGYMGAHENAIRQLKTSEQTNAELRTTVAKLERDVQIKQNEEKTIHSAYQMLQEKANLLENQLNVLKQGLGITADIHSPEGLRHVSQIASKLREAQEKLLKLAENNKLLLAELEDKRLVSQKAAALFKQLQKENRDLRTEAKTLKQELGHLKEITEKFRQQQVSLTDELEGQILKQVEETQSIMQQTQNALEEERRKFLEHIKRREQTKELLNGRLGSISSQPQQHGRSFDRPSSDSVHSFHDTSGHSNGHIETDLNIQSFEQYLRNDHHNHMTFAMKPQ